MTPIDFRKLIINQNYCTQIPYQELDKYHKFILHDSLNFFLKSFKVETFQEILEQKLLSKEDVRKYK